MKVRPSMNATGLTLLGAVFDGNPVESIQEIPGPVGE